MNPVSRHAALQHLRRWWPVYLVLAVSLAPVPWVYVKARESAEARREAEFRRLVEFVRSRADNQFTYYLALLHGLRGLFTASDRVTPEECASYLDSLELRPASSNSPPVLPALRDLGFAMRVRPEEKDTHRSIMRRQGFNGYTPLFLGPGPDHFPIVYLDELSPDRVSFSGWDPAGDPERWPAMELARDSGAAAATGPTTVFARDGTRRVPGFVIYHAVYRGGRTPDTVEARRERLLGFVFASMETRAMWRSIEEGVREFVLLQVFDGKEIREDRRVHPSAEEIAVAGDTPLIDGYSADGLGRGWTFFFSARPAFLHQNSDLTPLAVLVAGIALSLGLTATTGVLLGGRLRAEHITGKLRQSESRFRSVLESMGEGLVITDLQGLVLYANRRMAQWLGRDAVEVVGRSCDSLWSPRLPEDVNAAPAAAHSGERYEAQIVRQDGSLFWAAVTIVPFRDAAGSKVGSLAVVSDITERRHFAEMLSEEKERLTVTLRSISDGVVTTDTHARLLLMNPRAEELLGWSQAEAVGQPLSAIFAVRDETTARAHEDPVGRVLTTARVLEAVDPGLLRARDGQERLVTYSAAPIRDARGAAVGVVLVVRDATETRKLEAERQRSSKLESVGLLAGGIAHDFNNILTTIVGNLSLARMVARQDPELLAILGEVESAGWRAQELTRQLLTFARGGAPIRRAASLADLVRDTARFSLRGSNVRPEFATDPAPWPVEVDVGQISQVIQNLVVNALQAMPEGGTLRFRFDNLTLEAGTHPLLSPGPYVRVAVQDTGTGIKPDHLPRIFDPYFTTKQQGCGLGLTSAYSIVRRHGGVLTVESTLGQGTTFFAWLPASPEAAPKPEVRAERLLGGCGRVLVMDDEPAIRDVACRMLRHLGYEADGAVDGTEAIALVAAQGSGAKPFTAAILDLTIPGGMGGREAVRQLREQAPDLKAIVSSGYSNDPVMADYRRHGFDGVLTKPYKAEELARVLRDVLVPPEPGAHA